MDGLVPVTDNTHSTYETPPSPKNVLLQSTLHCTSLLLKALHALIVFVLILVLCAFSVLFLFSPTRRDTTQRPNKKKTHREQVSVPLMMTVKAVVTFENFRSDGIDPSNFVVPADYQRSRRMSKEKYIAGVVTGGGSGGGGGGGGEGDDRANSGAMDSDEEEEGDFVDDVDEAELSEGELLRRRAAQRNAFDDDEVGGGWVGDGWEEGGGREEGSAWRCC